MSDSNYLPSSEWDRLLAPGAARLSLVPYRGELWFQERETGQLVNVANQHLPALGLWTAQVRGIGHYADAVLETNTSPGFGLALVQQEGNAVAIQAEGRAVGYWNRGMAGRLIRAMDQGPLIAISLAGSPAGIMPTRIRVLAATVERMRDVGVASESL